MTNTDTNLGAFSRSRQQGPRFTVDRAPRTQSKTDPNAGSASIVHTRLHGSIPCTAFGIGPVSLRLSNLTLIVTDRPSVLSLVRLHVWFTDRAAIAHLAAPQRQPRNTATIPLGQVLTVVELCSTSTKGTVRASAARPDRPETSINIGPVRITACDRDAAASIAAAAAEAYEVARHTYTGLRTMAHHIEAHTKTQMVEASTV